MYSACLYCHGNLGKNELVPKFPVGRRLAFDSQKGRLWVVCGHCARWNLSALEERWEAIEECERHFRATRIRVSTENIGLAELSSGVVLIRIGKPLWPEFAAWRYGKRFSKRRVRTGLTAGTVVTSALALTAGVAAAGFGGLAFTMAYAAGIWIGDEGHKRRRATKVKLGNQICVLTQDHAEAMRIFPDGGPRRYGLAFHHSRGVELLRGPDVRRVMSHVIPALSPFGGDQNQVKGAIGMIDSAGSAEYYINDAMERANRASGFLTQLPVEGRLALEMSLQEDGERRALNGELAALERAWRDAEQIAAIADTLLLPSDVLERVAGLQRDVRSPGFAFS